ncbi:MAG: SDR family oxidoreductase [Cyclobacteriaceae bacterium]|nr:SDR family oxidoreductase [Cyclobacteriaceae bacterium]
MAYALITGASGGIGWALAKELASRKHDILLLARSEDSLKKNSEELRQKFGVKAEYLSIDLSLNDAALRVKEWLDQKNYAIDILINNAGFGSWGNLKDISRAELNQMMQLNMLSLADFCKVLLPELEKNNKAYILNVASTASYQAVPTLTTYAATKAFVVLFTRGLRWELKGGPVSVSCVSPGSTSTGFIDRANLGFMKEKAEKFTMKAEPVAKISIDGMFAGNAEIIPGFMNWISVKAVGLLPKVLSETIAKNLYKTDN